MIREAINILVSGGELSREKAACAMRSIMDGESTPAQTAAFITALAIRGESVSVITGCAEVMREKALCIHADEPLVDTCGTGGDRSSTFNISTAAALITAGAGVRVAKHGNRAASSNSGSADALAALGVNLDADVAVVEQCIADACIGFLFAPNFHTAMKNAMGPRREIGIRTIFNILGPLTNPAGAKHQVLGCSNPKLLETLAEVLRNLGSEHVYVVCGSDGLDEITTTSDTQIAELKDDIIRTYLVTPEQFGFARVRREALVVGSAEESAAVIRDILRGVKGPARDISVMNAGAAISAAGMAEDIAAGIRKAENSIDSGAAAMALEKLIRISNAK